MKVCVILFSLLLTQNVLANQNSCDSNLIDNFKNNYQTFWDKTIKENLSKTNIEIDQIEFQNKFEPLGDNLFRLTWAPKVISKKGTPLRLVAETPNREIEAIVLGVKLYSKKVFDDEGNHVGHNCIVQAGFSLPYPEMGTLWTDDPVFINENTGFIIVDTFYEQMQIADGCYIGRSNICPIDWNWIHFVNKRTKVKKYVPL